MNMAIVSYVALHSVVAYCHSVTETAEQISCYSECTLCLLAVVGGFVGWHAGCSASHLPSSVATQSSASQLPPHRLG